MHDFNYKEAKDIVNSITCRTIQILKRERRRSEADVQTFRRDEK